MDSTENYGSIIRILRKRSGYSIQNAAKMIQKSAGWLCEVENSVGTSRLSPSEFDRVVDLLGGSKDRHMFKTWIAGMKNQDRVSKIFDGAVLKFIRIKKGLSLTAGARMVGISKGYLSKLETGIAPITLERRNQIMRVYGYSLSSFKNWGTDPNRSKAVPNSFKFEILLHSISPEAADKIFQTALDNQQRQQSA